MVVSSRIPKNPTKVVSVTVVVREGAVMEGLPAFTCPLWAWMGLAVSTPL